MVLDQEIHKWKPFQRALRSPESELFEEMLDMSRLYASAAGMALRPVVLESMLMSILLAHHKMITDLQRKLKDHVDPEPLRKDDLRRFAQAEPTETRDD